MAGANGESVLAVLVIILGCTTADLCGTDSTTPVQSRVCNIPAIYGSGSAASATFNATDAVCSNVSYSDCNPSCYYCPYCPMTSASGSTTIKAFCTCAMPVTSQAPFLIDFLNPKSPTETRGYCNLYALCPTELDYTLAGFNCTGPGAILSGIAPAFGPLAGGTLAVLTGSNLDRLTDVYIGNSVCSLSALRTSRNATVAYCLTSADTGSGMNETRNLKWKAAGDSQFTNSSLNFTYLANPVVTNISRNTSISTGLEVIFNGNNFGSANAVFISMTCLAVPDSPVYYTECTVNKASSVSCVTPAFTVSGGCNFTQQYDAFLYLDGYYNFTNLMGATHTTVSAFHIPFTIRTTPTVSIFPTLAMLYVYDPLDTHNNDITLVGTDLDSADASQYVIEIGNNSWCHVSSVQSDSLTCTPPMSVEDVGLNYTEYLGQRAPSIVVRIPDYKLETFVGYVMFYNYHNGQIIIGVIFGVLALATVIIALSVLLYVRKEHARKRRKGDLYSMKKPLADSSASDLRL